MEYAIERHNDRGTRCIRLIVLVPDEESGTRSVLDIHETADTAPGLRMLLNRILQHEDANEYTVSRIPPSKRRRRIA